MFFSIIVPVYNTEKYLRDCIDSIINQDCEDYELIIVDDGSKDSSSEICDLYKNKNSRIHVIHKENGGLASARNAGLNAASGEWVLFVDSDDYIEKGTLRLLKNTVHNYPSQLYTFNRFKVTENGELISKDVHYIENSGEQFKSNEQNAEFIYNKLLKYKVGWEAWVQLFNREIIERNNIRFTDTAKIFAEDLLFSLKYYTCIRKVYYICNFLYCYRQIGNSIMHSLKEETILPRLFVLGEDYFGFCKKNKKKEHLKSFYKMYFSLIDFHIQYKLESINNEKIAEFIKNYNKKIHVDLIKKIKKNKKIFEYCSDKRKWLEYGI